MRKSLAGNAALTLVFQIVGIAASVLMGIGVARVLGPPGRGTFTFATVSLGLLATYAEGLSSAVIAQYKTDGMPSALVYRVMLRTLAWVSALLSGLTALCGFFVSGQGALLAVAAALPFALYSMAGKGFLVADQRLRQANVIGALSTVGLAALALPLLLLAHAPLAVVLGVWVGCYIASACLTAFWTWGYAVGPVDRRAMPEAGSKLLRFSLESCGVFFLSYLNLRIDLFIVGAVRGPVELGWYALAVSAAELLWQWSKALNWSAFGRLAGDEQSSALELLAKLTRNILFAQSALAVVAYWVAPTLITVVYGKAFAASAPIFRMLLPGIVAYSLEAAFGYVIMVRLKRPMVNFALQASSTAACALLTVLLLPRYGLVGAAFATSFTYCAVMLASVAIVVKVTDLHPLRLFVPNVHFRETMRPFGSYVGGVNGVSGGVHGFEGVRGVVGGERSGENDAGV